MKRAPFLAFSLVLLFATCLHAQSKRVVTEELVPIDTIQPADYLSGGCMTEDIAFEGDLLIENSTWLDHNGFTHLLMVERAVQVRGIGLTTGGTYLLLDRGFDESVNFGGFPSEQTTITTHRVIGRGPLPDETFSMIFHVRIDENGNTISEIDRITPVKCR